MPNFLNIKTVIPLIQNLKKRSTAGSIFTFEFSTLYVEIYHSKLMKVLNEFIDFSSSGRLHKYINVNRFGGK